MGKNVLDRNFQLVLNLPVLNFYILPSEKGAKILWLWIPFPPTFSRFELTFIILLYSVFLTLSHVFFFQVINEAPFSKDKNISSLDSVVLFLSYSFKPRFIRYCLHLLCYDSLTSASLLLTLANKIIGDPLLANSTDFFYVLLFCYIYTVGHSHTFNLFDNTVSINLDPNPNPFLFFCHL